MREECKNRIEVSLLEILDKADKLPAGSDERKNELNSAINLAKELNSIDKNASLIEIEKMKCELENKRIESESDDRFKERSIKSIEISNERSKSKKEFIAKLAVPVVSASLMIATAFMEARGYFIKREKIQKF